LIPSQHPIVPIILGDAQYADAIANAPRRRGVLVTAFPYSVVPIGQARIPTPMNADMTRAQLDFALSAFSEAKDEVMTV
jgi:glycine C-acetyltransferase